MVFVGLVALFSWFIVQQYSPVADNFWENASHESNRITMGIDLSERLEGRYNNGTSDVGGNNDHFTRTIRDGRRLINDNNNGGHNTGVATYLSNNLNRISTINESTKSSSRQDMFLLQESGRTTFTVSYPPAEYRFDKSMISKKLCDAYTLQCIYYRLEYPHGKLPFDLSTGKKYNPCRRFVEPCFGISEPDYNVVRKFRNLEDY